MKQQEESALFSQILASKVLALLERHEWAKTTFSRFLILGSRLFGPSRILVS